MSKYNFSLRIENFRRCGQIDEAVVVTKEAIEHYPDSNFFYKILGDLSMVKKDYVTAGNAYVEFLTKINEELQYFKNFVKFWARYKNAADEELLKQIYDKIVGLFNAGVFSAELKRNVAAVLYDAFPEENEIFKNVEKNEKTVTDWMEQQENSGNQWNIYRFLWWEQNNGVHSRKSAQKDKKLIAVMEKYELYSLALDLTECILVYDTDEVVIRTLFRLCRKTGDYGKADHYILMNPEVRQRQGFNIQYEFVYYYLNKNDETNLLRTLKRIRNSAESSIPISRTLQNFYVKLGMIDDAVEMRKHISLLEEKKYGFAKTVRVQKGTWEEQETEEAFWDTIKDMVSEQEHNRQLIAIKELLKGFSHELGQPITNIRYGVQLYQMKLSRGMGSGKELEMLLTDILNQTLRVDRLLKRFAPVVSGKSVNTWFNCIAHMKSVFQDMKMRLESVGIDVYIEGEQEFILYGDNVLFDQIIYNLISNSIDELKEKKGEKKIHVICHKNDRLLTVHFRDNGRGVPAEDVSKIFNPFYSTKDKEKSDGGEGLGLYIVWNILKMFGGKIKVNTDYQSGADFLIQIPEGDKSCV
ncbi:MAG: HAMP domain-containing histidine kinase [Lachnospiraceae bacterium]